MFPSELQSIESAVSRRLIAGSQACFGHHIAGYTVRYWRHKRSEGGFAARG